MYQDYSNLNQVITQGRNLHIFLSGGRLRVCRIEATESENLIYGEAPDLATALHHANENVIDKLDYEGQYRGDNAKYPHYLTGSSSREGDYLDACLFKGNLDFYKDGVLIVGHFSGSDNKMNPIILSFGGLNLNECIKGLSEILKAKLYD